MKSFDPTLYLVTDRSWLKDGQTLESCVEQAILGGVTLVQLREKNMSDEEFTENARKMLAVCRKHGVPLIINDRPDIAAKVGADGVHVGLDDMSVKEARRILGDGKIVGATAHNVREALTAEADGADYLGVGAVFGSSTKSDAKPLEMSELRAVCEAVEIPVCAIGGISKSNISRLCGSGIKGAAVISGILAEDDILSAAKELKEICGKL
ncbi:MAG: thiamine phosphate synthase [Oscillospiraceae bacterium]|nr:thiamine phosphate synthase [Oscillospiraceae bacterium]